MTDAPAAVMTRDDVRQQCCDFLDAVDEEIARRTDDLELSYLHRMRAAVAEVLDVISHDPEDADDEPPVQPPGGRAPLQ
jgi:hypothetical protein